jgi:hypothetical protein
VVYRPRASFILSPGEYSEAPLLVPGLLPTVLLSFIWSPGDNSDAPRVVPGLTVVVLFIRVPGAIPEAPGFSAAQTAADEPISRVVAAIIESLVILLLLLTVGPMTTANGLKGSFEAENLRSHSP